MCVPVPVLKQLLSLSVETRFMGVRSIFEFRATQKQESLRFGSPKKGNEMR